MRSYIFDCYGPAVRIVIEVAGGQQHDTDHAMKDHDRDPCLQRLGLDVLRFDDRQVLTQRTDVLEVISAQVQQRGFGSHR